MKPNAPFVLLLLVLSVSCAPSLTTTPTTAPIPTTVQVAIATATQVVLPTATATQSTTPTDTATPTVTPTNTPTHTPTPTPLPPLYIQGADFFADGKPVILRGAVANHFFYDRPSVYGNFQRDIDTLKSIGANFVIVDWNSGFTDNKDYVESLISGLEYAKQQGLRVELNLTVRGKQPNSNEPQMIVIVNDLIVNDWDLLLNDPVIAKRIADSVDIFNPLSEPQKNSGGQFIEWKEWKEIAQRAIQYIRQKINKPNAIGAASGVFWASDIRDAVSNPPTLANVGVEWHPYDGTMGNRGTDFMTQANAMIEKKNTLFFVGEMGYDAPLPAIEDKYKFLMSHGISFAVYGVSGGSSSPNFIIDRAGITERGKLAQKYFGVRK